MIDMTWSLGDRSPAFRSAATAPPAVRDERRWVSVLFVDLVGFTRLAGRLDPEDVCALQREYFNRVARAVRRWRGVVEKYIGDAVLVVFGAPDSDEYDAYRAVLAGLHVQRELAGLAWPDGTPVRARVGVATGEVVVDLAAVRDGGQALVCGDVVNTAARVQTHAAPGTVVVTAATRGATGPWVRYAPLPAITPAGKPAPVDVWQALSPVPPAAPGGNVPLVGRGAELSTVAGAVARAIAERAPALVRVTGPAGVGKSRLAREALSTAGARWWVGYCTPCGGRYSPLADLVRRQAEVGESTGPAEARRRLHAWAAGLVPEAALPAVLGGLSTLLTGAGPAGRDRAVESALLAVFRGAATRRPLALLLDDLHLADPATRAFAADLPARLGPEPLAVVVTDRACAQDAPAVVLEPLGAADTGRLLRHLLDQAGLPRHLAGRLAPLCGGIPGYAAEYTRTAATDGWPECGEPPMPPRVRGIASARLDRLDERDRRILGAAAILGDTITAEALAALLGGSRAAVREAIARLGDLLVPRGGAGYTFADPAVRQVVYARLPRAVRAGHHWRVALRPGKPTTRARHWSAAAALTRALRVNTWACVPGITQASGGRPAAPAAGAERAAGRPSRTRGGGPLLRLERADVGLHPVDERAQAPPVGAYEVEGGAPLQLRAGRVAPPGGQGLVAHQFEARVVGRAAARARAHPVATRREAVAGERTHDLLQRDAGGRGVDRGPEAGRLLPRVRVKPGRCKQALGVDVQVVADAAGHLEERALMGLVGRPVLGEAHVPVRPEDLRLGAHEGRQLRRELAHRPAHAGVVDVLVRGPVGLRVVGLEPFVEREGLGGKAGERHGARPRRRSAPWAWACASGGR
jgi:class 3 adenylate cyclase